MADYAAPAARVRRARRAEDAASLVRRLDWLLIAAVGALIGYGLWAIAGITRHDVEGEPSYYVVRQAIFLAIGLVGFVAAAVIDPHVLRRLARPLYGGLVLLLVLVLLAGTEVRGARRWIELSSFQFQPSEFGKVLIVVFLAAFLADRARRLGEASTIAAAVALAAVPIILVNREPDLGTALVYVAGLVGVLFIAGARWLHLGALVAFGTLVATALVWLLPSLGIQVLEDYQVGRLTVFTGSTQDPTGVGYNVEQSLTAIGAGGVEGRGVDGATQTRLEFVPEHATDFVFSALAEQRGFVGAAALLLLYLLLLWRGLRVVSSAGDAFSAMVAAGVVFALLFQIFVNVGMTMKIAPVTGIPLPFVSVGGSAMVANLLAMGLLVGIRARAPRRR
jgi:rod shape determining protein RodA